MLEDNGMLTIASLEAVREIGVPEEMIREAFGKKDYRIRKDMYGK